jgi:octanoyl-[GcvH]:protein N-octanoyltransferase
LQANAHNPAEPPAKPPLSLIRHGYPERPAFGTGVSEAIMWRVASGELGPTFRLHRPARELAFSKHDRASAGFAPAVRAARAAGFEPVVRLAGGRAAVFHEGTLAFAWSTPAERPTKGTHERFSLAAEIVTGALKRLGVDARIGEIPGEYCPGAWSVNAGGRVKLAGLGQRIVRGAAHIGVVVVVTDSDAIREALVPVYEALELEWDPETTGAIEDEVAGISLDDAEGAILAELAERYELVEAGFDERTLELARELEADHLA